MTLSSVHCYTIESIEWQPFALEHNTKEPIAIFSINTISHKHLLSKHQDILSVDETNKSYSYRFAIKREQHLINKCLLKILLGAYLGRSYNTIQLLSGSNGKPEVINQPTIHYSVSYSGDYMLLAIAAKEVGVDIECVRPNFHFQEIVDFSFNSSEQGFIKLHADPAQAFYTLWTRKEALVKATAKGIDDDFNNIPSLDGSHLIDQAKLATSLDWMTSSFAIGTDCIGAISYPSAFTSNDISFYTVDAVPSTLPTPRNQLPHN